MNILIFYDIIDDRIRKKLVNILIDFSFIRIQRSVFLGIVENDRLFKDMCSMILNFINIEQDLVFFFPLCEKDIKKLTLISGELDIKDFTASFLLI